MATNVCSGCKKKIVEFAYCSECMSGKPKNMRQIKDELLTMAGHKSERSSWSNATVNKSELEIIYNMVLKMKEDLQEK